MEKIKEFVEDNKGLLIASGCVGLSYFLGYKRGYRKTLKIVTKTFDAMRDRGFNVVRLIK